jgi:hypothetical protein
MKILLISFSPIKIEDGYQTHPIKRLPDIISYCKSVEIISTDEILM